jgi:hypothetical protein
MDSKPKLGHTSKGTNQVCLEKLLFRQESPGEVSSVV